MFNKNSSFQAVNGVEKIFPNYGWIFKILLHVLNVSWMIRICQIKYTSYLTPYYSDNYLLYIYVSFLMAFSIYWIKILNLPNELTFTSSIKLRQAFYINISAIKKLIPYFISLPIREKIIDEKAVLEIENKKSIYLKNNYDVMFLLLNSKIIYIAITVLSLMFLFNFFTEASFFRDYQKNWIFTSVLSIVVFELFFYVCVILMVFILKGIKK